MTATATETRAAAETRQAWMVAALSRAKRLPRLDEIMPRPMQTRAEREAEQRAAMAAFRAVAAARGQIKRWDQWLH